MSNKFICTSCGHVGQVERIMKGSFITELLLWLFLLLPGMFYTMWRYTSRYDGCPKCKKETMIPVDSPVGQKLLSETQQ